MSAPTSDSAGIRQAIRALREAGCGLVAVDQGDGRIKVRTEAEAVEEITAVDDAWLIIDIPGEDKRGWVRFVLGNNPEEVVCDYTVNLGHVLDPLIDGWIGL